MENKIKKIRYPNLLAEIKRCKKTQMEIGKMLGLSHTSINYRFSGKTEWTINEIEKLCNYFGKDYYELFKKEKV